LEPVHAAQGRSCDCASHLSTDLGADFYGLSIVVYGFVQAAHFAVDVAEVAEGCRHTVAGTGQLVAGTRANAGVEGRRQTALDTVQIGDAGERRGFALGPPGTPGQVTRCQVVRKRRVSK